MNWQNYDLIYVGISTHLSPICNGLVKSLLNILLYKEEEKYVMYATSPS